MADDGAGEGRVIHARSLGDRRDLGGAHASEQPVDAEIGRGAGGAKLGLAVQRNDLEKNPRAARTDRAGQFLQLRIGQADVLEADVANTERQRLVDARARVRRRAIPAGRHEDETQGHRHRLSLSRRAN